jgi:hypothetical protein
MAHTRPSKKYKIVAEEPGFKQLRARTSGALYTALSLLVALVGGTSGDLRGDRGTIESLKISKLLIWLAVKTGLIIS